MASAACVCKCITFDCLLCLSGQGHQHVQPWARRQRKERKSNRHTPHTRSSTNQVSKAQCPGTNAPSASWPSRADVTYVHSSGQLPPDRPLCLRSMRASRRLHHNQMLHANQGDSWAEFPSCTRDRNNNKSQCHPPRPQYPPWAFARDVLQAIH